MIKANNSADLMDRAVVYDLEYQHYLSPSCLSECTRLINTIRGMICNRYLSPNSVLSRVRFKSSLQPSSEYVFSWSASIVEIIHVFKFKTYQLTKLELVPCISIDLSVFDVSVNKKGFDQVSKDLHYWMKQGFDQVSKDLHYWMVQG